ncbi:MAG TPA: MFS transporter [Planctomycetaceae bacterium]|jgi:MFS family permease|nr:MFS transporter [Planctomycetaceae bacterium]
MLPSERCAEVRISPVREVYNRPFWLAYVANFALVTANSLMFRFAELVAYLGGSERAAGAIVGTGLFGVLVVRLFLGQGIDKYGTRTAWIVSTLLFIVGSGSFLACHEVSWGLYVARTVYSIGVAGMFTCSVVQVQNMVPPDRRTEAIGVLGTSGFLGMIAGASLGDGIFALYPLGDARFTALFGTAAGLGVFYLAVVAWLTRRHLHIRPQNAPAALRLLVHYWPGSVVLVAITLGMGLGVTTVFLTRFATELKLPGIRTFFTAYSIVALIFRVPGTRWAKTIGRHKTILLGLMGNAIGHFLLPFVTREWDFVLPAMACGFGHALLYPAIVSLGAGGFPRAYRGLGTTLILGFIELGTAVSPPILGWIIDRHGFPLMFYSASACGLAVAIYYALTAARQPDNDNDPEPEVFFDEEPVVSPSPDATRAN